MNLFSLWCKLRGKHKWGRARPNNDIAWEKPWSYYKVCRRCKTVAPVRRRNKVTA